MTADVYVLIRKEDYERMLKDKKINPSLIASETIVHTDQGGMNKHASSHSSHIGGNGGLNSEAPSEQLTTNNENSMSSLESETSTSSDESSVISSNESNSTDVDSDWFERWEGIYFPD